MNLFIISAAVALPVHCGPERKGLATYQQCMGPALCKYLANLIRGERDFVNWLSHSTSLLASECWRRAMPSA